MARWDSGDRRGARKPRPEQDRRRGRGARIDVDEQALQLREANASYSRIASRLSLRRATDAHGAFIRAVKSRSGEEQRTLVASEQARLNALEERIRSRDAAEPEKLQRRLEAVARLREALP
jgi:hypothetical protein